MRLQLETAQQSMQAALRQQEQKSAEDAQKCLRLLEQTAKREVQEAKREVRAKLQELEDRVARLERRPLSAGCVPVDGAVGRTALDALEDRVCQLEASVHRALETVFPRVDALVTHLEWRQSPEAPPVPARPSAQRSTSLRRAAFEPQCPPAGTSPPFIAPAIAEALGEDLIKAAKDGRAVEVRSLLDAGAEVNCLDNLGHTPLMLAAYGGHESVVSLLMQRGADVRARREDGWSALHLAACGERGGGCLRLLVEAGACVDSATAAGYTPLHVAAEFGNVQAARALAAAGASKTIRKGDGQTPFDLARSDVLRRLLRP